MELDGTGNRRPVRTTPLRDDEQRVVAAVCSGATLEHEPRTAPYHPLWGPLVAVRTGYATDDALRYAGSSGGVISALALHLVTSGQASFVLHVAADETDPFGNAARPSRDRDDVMAAAGSRYSPSSPLASIATYLDAGDRFAVVAKPCDIAALRRMAKRDPRVDRQVTHMIAFMCAGLPSRQASVEVVRAMGADPRAVRRFAYRGQGWPGFARAILADGSEKRMDYATSWGTILNRHLQFRCKICPDGTGEFADVVCADAWYGKDGYPDFAERDGRSLVLSRTAKGEALLGAALGAGGIGLEDLDVGEIEKMQPYQATRKRQVLARLAALAALRRPIPRYRGLHLVEVARGAGLEALARNFVGMLRRAGKAPRVKDVEAVR